MKIIVRNSFIKIFYAIVVLLMLSLPCLRSDDAIFGYDFLNAASADETRTSYGVLPDYILKPQDEINIDVWGDLKLHYSLTIGPDGYIVVPEVGRISLNGLTYAEGKSKILKHLASTYSFYINSENPGTGKAPVDITLGKTAGINVFVTGEVKNPGDINIKGTNASIINALKKSGVDGQASIRNIELKKLDGKILHFDLYEFLLKGVLPKEFKYLNDGDVVFVPLISKEVSLSGAVKRPGLYEILPEERLNDALAVAGGVQAGAQKEIKIFRKSEAKSTINIDEISVSNDDNPVLKNEDSVFVPGLSSDDKEKKYVTVKGEVESPGNYTYIKHETLDDLIKRSGGLGIGAYIKGAEFRRNGSVSIIDLEKALNEPKSNLNFEIFPGDEIIINKTDPFVVVKGAVLYPSSSLYKEGEKASYYIKNAGGYKNNADKDNVIIYSQGGVPEKAFKGFFSSDPLVPQGAVIDVPALTD